jgi:hypothetical protein
MNFNDLLSQPAHDIQEPKAVPPGHYTAIIIRQEFGKSTRKQTDYCRYIIKPISAQPDVDAKALMDSPLTEETTLRLDYFITANAVYRLRDFLINVIGLPDSKPLNELIPQAVNSTVMIEVSHQLNDKGKAFANISDVARA